VAAWFKTAAAMGSALPDPVKDNAATAPIPQQAIENKPAPGQTGPKGMSPRTTYSRVNTGAPPVMDAGAVGQKSGPNLGLNSLPKLAAPRGCMTTIQERPSLQELVKAAMAGTRTRLEVNLEASRQERSQTKTASAPKTEPLSLTGHVSTELVSKLAGALGYIEDQLRKEAELQPGEGPGALQVLEATSSEKNIDAGQGGQATSQNQPPQSPSLQPEKVQQGNAGTGLATNDDMKHPEQPVEPIKNAAANLEALNRDRLAKLAGVGDVVKNLGGKAKAVASEAKDIFSGSRARGAIGEFRGAKKGLQNAESNLAVAEKNRAPSRITDAIKGDVGAASKAHGEARSKAIKETGKTVGAYGAAAGAAGGAAAAASGGKKKESSGTLALIRQLTVKVAEDAINPAQISSGTVDPVAPPEGASASGEGVPSEPSDVTSQKRLIQSNEAAINYTKGEAKADPKKDVAQVLNEPPLTSSTDKVLNLAFDSTGQAGVKISSAGGLQKTASQLGATRVLLARLIKEAAVKTSTGAGAATMGQ
jgi:hypothetical protein